MGDYSSPSAPTAAQVAAAFPVDPITLASAATVAEGIRVTGDTVDRYTLGADGKQQFGPGSGAADTTLYRGAANLLKTDNELDAGWDLLARAGGATQVRVGNAGPAAQSGLNLQGGEAGSNLYRSAAGTLTCDGVLLAANVGTILSGQLTGGADVALSTTVYTTVITTAALAVGTWLLDASVTVANGNAVIGTAEITAAVGTATATFAGAQSGQAELPAISGGAVQLGVVCVVTVTVAGTLIIQVKAPGTSASTAKNTTPTTGSAKASGYTAVRIA